MDQLTYQELKNQAETKDFGYWQDLALSRSLRLFHEAAQRVPAYKDFLKKNKVEPNKIKDLADFVNVPIIDKENYVLQYKANELCWDGDISRGGIISQSSGTTGDPIFWPRFATNDKDVALLHEFFFKNLYLTYEKETLFVVCFHLSAHIAGIITANAIKDLIDEGMPGSLVTAGLNKRDIFNSLEKLSPLFKQTVLIGYPPFLMDIVCEGAERGFEWSDKNIKFMFAAESFPEKWRQNLYHKVGISDIENGGYNVYGSADLGFMGHETPFTIRLRQSLESGKIDKDSLGIGNNHLPGIYQYHAWDKYFEEVENELICTSNSGIPLIRYNIHDVGKILDPEFIDQKCRQENILQDGDWRFPTLFIFGRSNYSATLYGVNIYPEHIREVFSKDNVSGHLSGKFFMKTVYDGEKQYLEIHAESLPGSSDHKAEDLEEILGNHLKEINLEYKKLYEAVGGKAKPVLVIYEHGSEEFTNLKSKHRYIVKDDK